MKMTTERLMEMMIGAIEKMSDHEKAKIRAALKDYFLKPKEVPRVN